MEAKNELSLSVTSVLNDIYKSGLYLLHVLPQTIHLTDNFNINHHAPTSIKV